MEKIIAAFLDGLSEEGASLLEEKIGSAAYTVTYLEYIGNIFTRCPN